MGSRLTRLQKIFRRSHPIPEGADTSDEHWDDLPYGGAVLFTRPSAAQFGSEKANAFEGDQEIDPEWQELLSWAQVADLADTGSSLPATSATATAEVVAGDDADEWVAEIVRAKRAATIDTPAMPAPTVQSAPSGRQTAPPTSLSPVDEDDDEAEWAQCLAHAKLHVDPKASNAAEDAEWAECLARAKAEEADAKASNAAEDAEWAECLARAKAEEAEWRFLIQRASTRPSARQEIGNIAKLMDRMRAGGTKARVLA